MRDATRIHEVLAVIEAEWVKCPHMRLGQLLYFLLGNHMADMFYVEDGQWLALQTRYTSHFVTSIPKNVTSG